MRNPAVKAPVGSFCSKCGEQITEGEDEGRRYRMKWVHIRCLPATRKKKIRGTNEYHDATMERISKSISKFKKGQVRRGRR
jgi:hypothetical protein